MATAPQAEKQSLTVETEFWDQLAPHHAAFENNFFDLRSARTLLRELLPPVLIVGAGQGLIVNELLQQGVRCDGIDMSPEMIRYAKERRGLKFLCANAVAMPFCDQSYGTIIYATGVLDFMVDDQAISRILIEGHRIAHQSGKIFVAFYRFSEALEQFLRLVGLLQNGVLDHKGSLETYFLTLPQMMRWIMGRINLEAPRALALFLKVMIRTSLREKVNASRMQKLFRDRETALRLVESAPQHQPYRRKPEIEALFSRLAIPAKGIRTLRSCFIAEI